MQVRILIIILLFLSGTIALSFLPACHSAEKALSASETERIPPKIVRVEDLPSGIQFNKPGSIHYVQLYPDEKSQSRQPAVVEQTTAKEDPEPENTPSDKQTYREDAVKDLISTRSKSVYYIVAGSFLTEQNARSFAEELVKSGFKNCEVRIFNDRYYRVIPDTFTNEEDARRFLSEFSKTDPDYTGAWILKNK